MMNSLLRIGEVYPGVSSGCETSRKVLAKVLKAFIVHRCSPSIGSVRQCSVRGKGFHLLSFGV